MLKLSKVPFSSLNTLTVKYENGFRLFITLSLNHIDKDPFTACRNLAFYSLIIFSNSFQYSR